MVNTMLPELAVGLDTSLSTAASALTWYMLPFAGLLVVSGTLATRWGEVQTLRAAYALFALASLVCSLTSTSGLFLAARAIQGAANAFTTPVLIALIARLQPRGRVGRSIGIYASMQAAGQAFAPLVGGVAADVDYRLAFVATGSVALFLMTITSSAPQDRGVVAPTSRPDPGTQPWRSLVNWRLARASSVAFCVQFAGTGLMVLGALYCADRFGLAPSIRGALVAVFGLAGLLTGSLTGRLADRFGLRRLGIIAITLLAMATASLGLVTVAWMLVVIMFTAGAAATGGRILAQALFIASTPANPVGATSLGLGVQFLGTAAAPLLITIYHRDVLTASVIAGAVALVGATLMVWPRSG